MIYELIRFWQQYTESLDLVRKSNLVLELIYIRKEIYDNENYMQKNK